MAERVCAIDAFSEILTSGGIVKGGSPPLCLYPPLTRQKIMKKYLFYAYVILTDESGQEYIEYSYVYSYSSCKALAILLNNIMPHYNDKIYKLTDKHVHQIENFLK